MGTVHCYLIKLWPGCCCERRMGRMQLKSLLNWLWVREIILGGFDLNSWKAVRAKLKLSFQREEIPSPQQDLQPVPVRSQPAHHLPSWDLPYRLRTRFIIPHDYICNFLYNKSISIPLILIFWLNFNRYIQ